MTILRNAIASTSKAAFALHTPFLAASPCWCTRRLSSRISEKLDAAGKRSSFSSSARVRAKAPIQQLRDEAIKTRYVKLVGEDGLGPLREKARTLSRLDRAKSWLLQVDQQPLSDIEAGDLGIRRELPQMVSICKIVNKKASYDAAREKTAQQKVKKKAGKMEEKEFQLTWGVSVNDLSHKLKRAQAVIDKAGRVALVISSPKNTKVPSKPERDAFVEMCKQALGEKDGKVSIWKPEEWMGSRTSVYLQGIAMKE